MLHPYAERVWSFGYVSSWKFIHYWLENAQKKKKNSALFIFLFSIGHVYGRASLLHWVHVLERVRMRSFFWDFILVCVLGDSMNCLFDFCERDGWLFFSISGSLLYPSFNLFRMWLLSMLWCRLTITHFFISLSSFISALFLYFTLPHLISFFSHPAQCLTEVQHPHIIFAYLICSFIYHHFSCGNPWVRDSWRFLRIASHAWGVWGLYHRDLWA